MIRSWPILILTLASVLFTGCRNKVSDVFRNSQGKEYSRVVETPGHQATLRFLPRAASLLMSSGVDSSTLVTAALLDSLEEALGTGRGLTFLMRLEPLGAGPGPDLGKDLLYGDAAGGETFSAYTFGMTEKIWLEVDGHKIPLTRYQVENTFGMEPGRNFMLLFPDIRANESGTNTVIHLVLDDILPGLGRRKIEWKIPVGEYDKA